MGNASKFCDARKRDCHTELGEQTADDGTRPALADKT